MFIEHSASFTCWNISKDECENTAWALESICFSRYEYRGWHLNLKRGCYQHCGILEQEVFINMLIIITFPLYWKTSATFPSLWNNWSSSFHLHSTSFLLEQKLSLMNFSLLHFFPNVNYFLVELDQMCNVCSILSIRSDWCYLYLCNGSIVSSSKYLLPGYCSASDNNSL